LCGVNLEQTSNLDCNAVRGFDGQSFVRSRSVVSRIVAGETLIVPVRGKVGDLASIYSFNGSATLIWKLLESPKTFTELVDGVEGEYEVERERAEKDALQFLNDLLSVELIKVRSAAAQIETEAGATRTAVAMHGAESCA
jgi:Coenzyme PQQ synthesis protein D (PqqD)